MEDNHAEWTDERLFEKLKELREVDQPWQCPERRQEVGQRVGRIIFEQMYRYKNNHKESNE